MCVRGSSVNRSSTSFLRPENQESSPALVVAAHIHAARKSSYTTQTASLTMGAKLNSKNSPLLPSFLPLPLSQILFFSTFPHFLSLSLLLAHFISLSATLRFLQLISVSPSSFPNLLSLCISFSLFFHPNLYQPPFSLHPSSSLVLFILPPMRSLSLPFFHYLFLS